MKTKSKYHEFSQDELTVLRFLKNMKQYAPENFDYLGYYGASAREMIKLMEYPEKYTNHDFGYVCNLFDAIRKTFREYIVESPEIAEQAEEDRILASILIYSNSAFLSIYANERLINKAHLFAYLLRKKEIYKWNGWLQMMVQKNIEKMKSEMRFKLGVVG